jgi:hypothetical protein
MKPEVSLKSEKVQPLAERDSLSEAMAGPGVPGPTELSSATALTRPARALIGWLSPDEGMLWLAGRQTAQAANPEDLARCERAREVVSRRPPGVDQVNVFSDLPDSILPHIEALKQDPKSANVIAQSGAVRLVDLSRICAAQPQIHIEDAVKRVEGLESDDLMGIARVTLPLPTPEQLPAMFDPVKQAWIISSPNPNLRVAGNFNGPVGPGMIGYGFAITISKSYLQVAGLNGRYFLRDGYHRAYGLLAAGIHVAPAFVKDFSTIEEVGLPAGLLPSSAYLGDRPPVLLDYLNDDVSAPTKLPLTQKLLVVQGLELHTLG